MMNNTSGFVLPPGTAFKQMKWKLAFNFAFLL